MTGPRLLLPHPDVPGGEPLWSAGYREWQPPAALRAGVACFWVSVVPPGSGPSVTAVLPDGCTDLMWQSGRGGYVAGPDTGPAPVELPAGTVIAGVRFRPGAGGPMLGLPLRQLRDQRVDLADCLPRLARMLPPDLPPDAALDQLYEIAAALATDGKPDAAVRYGTRLLGSGQHSVATLSRELSISERQLRRRFESAAGYGPKTMQRVLRFRRLTLRLMSDPAGADLARLASQLGYADQAHLTRETTEFAGLPPAALARTFLTRH